MFWELAVQGLGFWDSGVEAFRVRGGGWGVGFRDVGV